MNYDKILVIDFGSQYNQLIARRIREMNVYSELISCHTKASTIKNDPSVKGIILSGGPKSVYEENSFTCDEEIFKLNIPILGICYGMQYIAYKFGGNVQTLNNKEFGKQEISTVESTLFAGSPKKQNVWMSHGDQVTSLPEDFKVIASSETTDICAFENERLGLYGVQFHPEVKHTDYGNKILENFIFKIAKAVPNWKISDYIDQKVLEIKKTVGDNKVLMAVSGGVDSSVAACLIEKAINKNLTCFFVDHGLLRKNEAVEVMDFFENKFNINVIKIDAKERFLNKLKNVIDPEEKRKIIGHEFVKIFEEVADKYGKDYKFLGQGTLYTDVIESGTSTAQTIKSHHNVGGLPKDMNFTLLEPLNKLFKDEVRALGIELGINESLIYRQPFPGPGLGIRILGEVTLEKIRIVQDSDYILREEIKKAGLDKQIWQYFTVCTSSKTVGVMGDQRTYSYCVAIRAITSVDGMTADWSRIPYEVLDVISRRIVNEVSGCNRVVYDITSKPPGTIEWE